MEQQYNYETRATWIDRRKGLLEGENSYPVTVSAPPEFKGEAGYWSPEHLLVGAVESCWLTTFLAIAEASRLQVLSYRSSAATSLERPDGKGFLLTAVTVKPVIEVVYGDHEKAGRVIEKAEKHCFISTALSIPVHVEPSIVVRQIEPVAEAA